MGIHMLIVGIRLQTWTRVIVYRSVDQVFRTDLSAVVTTYVHLPLPGLRLRVTIKVQ